MVLNSRVNMVAMVLLSAICFVVVNNNNQVTCHDDDNNESFALDNQFFKRKLEELQQVQEAIDLLGAGENNATGANSDLSIIASNLPKANAIVSQLERISSTLATGQHQQALKCQSSYQSIIGSSLLNLLTEFTSHNGELVTLQSKSSNQYLLDNPMELAMALAQFEALHDSQKAIIDNNCLARQ